MDYVRFVQAPDELIVASIVDNVDDPGLASSRLGGPCKVASVQPGHKIGYIVSKYWVKDWQYIVSRIGLKIGKIRFEELGKRLGK